jgi:transposase-like protein
LLRAVAANVLRARLLGGIRNKAARGELRISEVARRNGVARGLLTAWRHTTENTSNRSLTDAELDEVSGGFCWDMEWYYEGEGPDLSEVLSASASPERTR